MQLKTVQQLELPPTADMHVHLRQDDMMALVAPTVRHGGVDTVFVMPNLVRHITTLCLRLPIMASSKKTGIMKHGNVVPPITTVERALQYKSQLQQIEPNVQYLMSLFLHPSVTPEVIAQAAESRIVGVKMYPQGVTTNSENGVANVEAFYPTFAAMEEHDLVLNLHGEVLEALAPEETSLEEAFLPTLRKLHDRFPRLRIVLEHCTTSAAVEAVKACGPSVGATITAHHLYLTGADACCDPFAFCKPIPKKPTDRDALLKAVVSGNQKFFFGSDSAPHQKLSKTSAEQGKAPAGVFTQPAATQLVLLALEEGIDRGDILEADVTQEKLQGFLSLNGRKFYKLAERPNEKIVLERKGEKVGTSVRSADGKTEVAISRGGTGGIFSLAWASA